MRSSAGSWTRWPCSTWATWPRTDIRPGRTLPPGRAARRPAAPRGGRDGQPVGRRVARPLAGVPPAIARRRHRRASRRPRRRPERQGGRSRHRRRVARGGAARRDRGPFRGGRRLAPCRPGRRGSRDDAGIGPPSAAGHRSDSLRPDPEASARPGSGARRRPRGLPPRLRGQHSNGSSLPGSRIGEAARACLVGPDAVDDISLPRRWIEAALAREPRTPWLHYYLGLADFRAGLYEGAVEHLRESLKLGTGWAAAPVNDSPERLEREAAKDPQGLAAVAYERLKAEGATRRYSGISELRPEGPRCSPWPALYSQSRS